MTKSISPAAVLRLATGGARSSFGSILDAIARRRAELAAPEQQSEYFRMGIDSHRRRLAGLTAEAEAFRAAFNATTVAELRADRHRQEEALVEYAKFEPRLVREILRASLRHRIATIDEMLALKEDLEQLPPIDELLEAIASAH